MRMHPGLLLLAASLLAACGGGATTPNLRGHYWWGSQVEAFRPCESTQSFWVVGEARVLDPLRNKSLALANVAGRHYQPIYVEAIGEPEDKATEGIASQFSGTYRFEQVLAAGGTPPVGCKPQ